MTSFSSVLSSSGEKSSQFFPPGTRPAGFFIRVVAAIVDLALVVAVTWILGVLLVRTRNPVEEQDQLIELFLGISAIYSIGFTVKWGGTFGKRLFGMYVIRMRDGAPLKWHQALLRWAGYFLSMSVFGAGFLMAAFHPLKRTIHDLLAGSRVVRLVR